VQRGAHDQSVWTTSVGFSRAGKFLTSERVAEAYGKKIEKFTTFLLGVPFHFDGSIILFVWGFV
jgi:hypothetical protein